MSRHSKIEWTDATWNPVTGCTKTSPGCKFCYAERITRQQGEDFSKVTLHPDRLDQPLRWRKPRHIFVCSMGDLFHEKIPDEFIGKVWNIMLDARQHTFQVLTKRARRMSEWVRTRTIAAADTKPYGHIWCGVSCETQAYADEHIPWLLKTPATMRFVSLEPMLEPVDLRQYLSGIARDHYEAEAVAMGAGKPGPFLDWVIAGGESGGPPERALVDFDSAIYIRIHRKVYYPKPQSLFQLCSLRDQCVAAGVPFFFKGWGGPTPKTGGRLLDDRTWDEVPTINSPYLFRRAADEPSRGSR